MYSHKDEDIFVIDSHVHHWDASKSNIIHEGGEQFIQNFYENHMAFSPEDARWELDEFRKYDSDRMLRDLFRDGYVDMGIFQPTYLREFYENGFNTVERNGSVVKEYPERFIVNGRFDPREGEEGLKELEQQKEQYDIDGVKLYTAEWYEGSKGWRLDSEASFEFLEKCVELGIENIHPHKGPTFRPLNKDAFDVGDVDAAAMSFPELNFIVEHVGVPRLDDFAWIAGQKSNVYGGLAAIVAMGRVRERKFGDILGELLWWLGEEKILFGSDYALWSPEWTVETMMDAELTDEQQDEYGVELTLETKKKILGENAARLYNIDIEEKKAQLEEDDIAARFDITDQYVEEAAGD